MTIEQAKAKQKAWLSSQLGTREGSNNWNKYAEDQNMTKLLGWRAQNQPWCNIFCNAAFITVFGLESGAAMIYQKIGSGSALCRTSAQFFKDHNAFVHSPEECDIVFFYSGGDINHQGMVTKVSNGLITTIEGNSSDAVSARTYRISDPSIAGFGRPNWSVVAQPVSRTQDPEAQKPKPSPATGISIAVEEVKFGSTGVYAAMMQGALKFLGFDLGFYGVDGEIGGASHGALRAFQTSRGLPETGICDKRTWEALLK